MSATGSNPWMTPIMLGAAIFLIIFINVYRYRKKKNADS